MRSGLIHGCAAVGDISLLSQIRVWQPSKWIECGGAEGALCLEFGSAHCVVDCNSDVDTERQSS